MATFDLFRNNNLLNNEQFRRNNPDDSTLKICLKTGMLISVLLILTFVVLCAYTNRFEINQLSAVNMLFLALGVYYALENYSVDGKAGSIDYFEGFKVGMGTSIIAVSLHALFLLVYSYFDSSVLQEINREHFYSEVLNPFSAAGITLFEGLASGLIITFCIMQYFKKNEP